MVPNETGGFIDRALRSLNVLLDSARGIYRPQSGPSTGYVVSFIFPIFISIMRDFYFYNEGMDYGWTGPGDFNKRPFRSTEVDA